MKKKIFKRAGVAVLSMAMLLSVGAIGGLSASAANYTVNPTTALTSENSKFKIYKVCDNLLNMESGWTLPTGKVIGDYVGIADNAALAKELAGTLAGQLSGKTPVNTASGTALGTNYDLADGYYLVIIETTGTNDLVEPMLVQVKDGNVTNSTPKTQTLTLTKGITEVDNAVTSVGNATPNVSNVTDSTGEVKVGDVVEYEINTSLPKYNPALTTITTLAYITDTPTNLNDDNSTVTVYYKGGDTGETDYTAMANTYYTLTEEGTVVTGTDKQGFKIEFTSAGMITYRGCDIKVTYSATVLDGVNTTTTGNPNTAALTYSRNYQTGNGDTTTVQDTAIVYSTSFNIHKTVGSTTVAGIGFTMMKDGKYVQADGSLGTTLHEFTTDASGNITVSGIDAGTYTITESTPPTGSYRHLAGSITVNVTASKTGSLYNGAYTYSRTCTDTSDETYATLSDNTLTVQNPAYNSLPGTGGMGTVLFTVGGAAIVLLAGAMFVLYMKKRRVEE